MSKENPTRRLKNHDRRQKRTRKMLMEALIALSQRDGYDAVTIRDITTYADISYSTFFRHYRDKDDLLMKMIHDTVEELRELVQSHPSAEANGEILFQHVADNQALYRALLGGFNSSAMVLKVQDMIVSEIRGRIPPSTDEKAIPADVAANHVAASALAMVKWWLDNGMPYTAQRMGTFYAALIVAPIGRR